MKESVVTGSWANWVDVGARLNQCTKPTVLSSFLFRPFGSLLHFKSSLVALCQPRGRLRATRWTAPETGVTGPDTRARWSWPCASFDERQSVVA